MSCRLKGRYVDALLSNLVFDDPNACMLRTVGAVEVMRQNFVMKNEARRIIRISFYTWIVLGLLLLNRR